MKIKSFEEFCNESTINSILSYIKKVYKTGIYNGPTTAQIDNMDIVISTDTYENSDKIHITEPSGASIIFVWKDNYALGTYLRNRRKLANTIVDYLNS